MPFEGMSLARSSAVLRVGAGTASSAGSASSATTGTACLIIAATIWTACVGIQTRAYRDNRTAPFALRVALGQLTTIPLIVGSGMLMTGGTAGFFWLAAGTLLAVVTGVLATWVLLVEILR